MNNSIILLSQLKNAVTNLEFNLGKRQHYRAMKWAEGVRSMAHDISITERDLYRLLPEEQRNDQKDK
jgi:hypothetical protein